MIFRIKPLYTFLIGTILLAIVAVFIFRARDSTLQGDSRYEAGESYGSFPSPFLCI